MRGEGMSKWSEHREPIAFDAGRHHESLAESIFAALMLVAALGCLCLLAMSFAQRGL